MGVRVVSSAATFPKAGIASVRAWAVCLLSFYSLGFQVVVSPTPCCKKEPSFGSLGGVWTSDSPSLARGAITIAGSVCLSEGPSFARWVSSFVSSKVTFSSLSTILLGHIRDRCPCSWQIMHPKGTAPFHSPGYSIVCLELLGLWILAGLCPAVTHILAQLWTPCLSRGLPALTNPPA